MPKTKRRRLLTLEAKRGLNTILNLAAKRLGELDEELCEQLFGIDDPTGEGNCSCSVCTEYWEIGAGMKWIQKKLEG